MWLMLLGGLLISTPDGAASAGSEEQPDQTTCRLSKRTCSDATYDH